MIKCQCLCLLIIVTTFNLINASGLYKPTDNVTIFNADNIVITLTSSPTLWLVEYYLEWCGHCQDYAPIYKSFATDVADWFPVVKLGAVNCADKENNDFCTKQNITGVPALKFYTTLSNLSREEGVFVKSFEDVKLLRESLTKQVEKNIDTVLWNYRRPKPSFIPASYGFVMRHLSSRKRFFANYIYLALVFEEDSSMLGKEVVLDMSSCSNIIVRRVLIGSEDGKTLQKKFGNTNPLSLLVLVNNGSFFFLHSAEKTRRSYVSQLKHLKGVGEEKDEFLLFNSSVHLHQGPNIAIDDRKISRDRVYLSDIESGLFYMFTMEIPSSKIISGPKLDALKMLLKFFTDVSDHFPGRKTTESFLIEIYLWIKPKHVIVASEWLKIVKEKRVDCFLPETDKQWVGCRSSVPNRRGYPCSLWTIFHTLAVSAYNSDVDRRLLSDVMYGYITNFFGCRECRENFKKEVIALPYQFTEKKEDAVLWLWRMHNKVNKRLHINSTSEDPAFPKLQFPPANMCPKCCDAETSRWNEDEVASFLIERFSSESISWDFVDDENVNEDPLYRDMLVLGDHGPAVRQGQIEEFHPRGSHRRRSHDLPLFMSDLDISMCLLIWMASASLIIFLIIVVHSRGGWLRNFKPSRLSL